jgi:hypothetical protein
VLLGKQHVQIFAPFLVKQASQFDYDYLLCPFEKSKAKLDNLLLKAGTTFPRKWGAIRKTTRSNFRALFGQARDTIQDKRLAEQDPNYVT